jgi:hypothetical protein
MKTVGFAATAVLLFVQLSIAQVRVGLTGGLNISQADQSSFYYSRASSTTGIVIGGVLDCPITKNLSLLVEPTYSEKGTTAQPVLYQDDVSKVNFDLSYFEVPLLLKYSVGKDIRPYLLVGTTFGFNLSSNVGAEVRGPWFGQLEIETGAGNAVRDLECSVEFGGGVSCQLDEYLALFVEARYAHAVTNALRHETALVSLPEESVGYEMQHGAVYRNKGFKLMAGFTFPL